MKKVANTETTAQKTLSPIGVQLSTIELAELSGRRHSHILRSVERMNKDLIAMNKPPAVASQYKDSTGRTLPSYNLTKYQCELLAMALSGEARIRVLDRLYELEQKNSELPTSISSPEQMNEIITNFIKTHDMLETENYMTLMMAPFKVFWAYQKKNENLTKLLEEQHELIGELTAENGKLTKENHSLKNDPLSMLVTSLKIATGREVQLSLGPTTGQNIDHTHTTIKGFCAEHKIKLAHGDSIRFSNILKSLCKQAGEIIEKIPDARYGTLNIYPRYLLADAIKFL